MKALLLGALGALTLLRPAPTQAADCANRKPEWVFCDDFESSQDQTGALGLWDDQGLGPQNLVVVNDPAKVHGGKRALEITAHKGMDTGGGPTKWFLPGYDRIYIQFWTRFATDYNYLHHMVFIGASQASNKWSAFGTAGCRPSGTNFFVTQVEPFPESGKHPPPGAWGFYTYSNDMKCDPGATCANYANPQQICNDCATKGSPCTNGLECCWGANNVTSPAVRTPLGQWVCVEARVDANTGSTANGAQTLWIDDKQVGQWSGIRFRTDDALKINSLGLWHYVTDDAYTTGQTQETLWFDDVVVSTAPIGCGAEPPDAGARDGGASGAGGAGGAGGLAGAGGTSGSGGSATGGASGKGGTSGTGSGGASAGAGGVSAGGAGGGGTSSTGGAGGGNAGEGGASGSASNAKTDSACGCRIVGSRSKGSALAVMASFLLLAARRRKVSPVRARMRRSLIGVVAILGGALAGLLGCSDASSPLEEDRVLGDGGADRTDSIAVDAVGIDAGCSCWDSDSFGVGIVTLECFCAANPCPSFSAATTCPPPSPFVNMRVERYDACNLIAVQLDVEHESMRYVYQAKTLAFAGAERTIDRPSFPCSAGAVRTIVAGTSVPLGCGGDKEVLCPVPFRTRL